MYSWHIDSAIRTSLLLWRVDQRTFRVVQYDKPQVILTNIDYFLIDNKYLKTFTKLNDQLTINTEITIVDNVRNLTLDNYFEIKVHNVINTNDISQIDTTGLKIWKFSEYLFVSDDFKHELELIDNRELDFSLGFSKFG